MNHFTVPTKEQVSLPNQAVFEKLTGALGMVPNLYAAMAHSENGLIRYIDFQSSKTSLSNREKEAVNLVVSQVNGCRYCQSAHTVLGKMNGFTDEEVLEIRKGNGNNSKLDALVKLAKAITEKRGYVSGELLDNFHAAGYNEASLVDLVLQVSDKTAMNYLHNITQIPIDFPVAPEL